MHVKKNDQVLVLIGDDRGVTGRVLSVDYEAGKVLVEGVNRVYKHVRRSQKNPQGGRLSKEMPVQISNIKVVCPACNQPARNGMRYKDDGVKERYCKKCGNSQGELSPPRARYAKKS